MPQAQASCHPGVGVIGGKPSEPAFEHEPHPANSDFHEPNLAELRAIAEEATSRLRQAGLAPEDLSARLHLPVTPVSRPPGSTANGALLPREAPWASLPVAESIVEVHTGGIPGQPIISAETTGVLVRGLVPGTSRVIDRRTGLTMAVVAEPSSAFLPAIPPTVALGGTAPPAPPWWRTGRILRYAAALVLLLLALWTVIIPGLFPVSSNAAVNARLLTIRSPIEGVSTRPPKVLGDLVKQGEVVARIRNDRVDTSRLDGLGTQRTNLLARSDANVQDQESRRRVRTDLDQRHVEATAAVARAETVLATTASGFARLQAVSLNIPGGISASELERSQGTRDQAQQDLLAVKAGLARTVSQIAAVDAHQFLDQQAPYQAERLVVLESLITDLEVKSAEIRRNLADLDLELSKEQARLERLREAVLESNIDGLVWKVQANAGQFLPMGADVVQIAETSTIAVEAWLHQRYLGDANVGDRAIVYLTGDHQRLEGTVTNVNVQGQVVSDETTAYALPAESPKSFKVTIKLDRNFFTVGMIGQRAKVLLCGKNVGVAGSILLWFYTLVEF